MSYLTKKYEKVLTLDYLCKNTLGKIQSVQLVIECEITNCLNFIFLNGKPKKKKKKYQSFIKYLTFSRYIVIKKENTCIPERSRIIRET